MAGDLYCIITVIDAWKQNRCMGRSNWQPQTAVSFLTLEWINLINNSSLKSVNFVVPMSLFICSTIQGQSSYVYVCVCVLGSFWIVASWNTLRTRITSLARAAAGLSSTEPDIVTGQWPSNVFTSRSVGSRPSAVTQVQVELVFWKRQTDHFYLPSWKKLLKQWWLSVLHNH